MGRRRLDTVQYLAQRPEYGFSIFGLFFDLRLEEQMYVVRHHAGSEEFILMMLVRVENTLQHDIALRGSELSLLVSCEGDHVLGPRTLKMW